MRREGRVDVRGGVAEALDAVPRDADGVPPGEVVCKGRAILRPPARGGGGGSGGGGEGRLMAWWQGGYRGKNAARHEETRKG